MYVTVFNTLEQLLATMMRLSLSMNEHLLTNKSTRLVCLSASDCITLAPMDPHLSADRKCMLSMPLMQSERPSSVTSWQFSMPRTTGTIMQCCVLR